MGSGIFAIVLLGAHALLLVLAGVEDARTRNIANWKNIAIALLAPLWWWASGLSVWPDIALQIGVALGVFALFCVAFHYNWMGGGDVKMIGAVALWFPVVPLVSLLIVMSLLGGALTVVLMIEQKLRGKTGQIEIPYGVAIAFAGLFALREPIFNQIL